MEPELIEHIFTYHPPRGDQQAIYAAIGEEFMSMAKFLNEVLPEGAGKTSTIRAVAQVRMQANAAVALGGRF